MNRFLTAVITVALITSTATASEFEQSSREVLASDTLETSSLKGRYHQVDEKVTVSGYMNHFTVNSNFGQFLVVGNLGLKRLLHELDAIAELKRRSATDAGTDAVTGVVSDTGDSLARLAADPAGTAQGITGGVSRFFKRTKRSAKSLADQTSDTISGDDESAHKVDGSEVAQQVAESYLGVGKAQRKLAQELGVDPYTRNKVLQDELHRVASISGTVGKVTKMLLPMPAFVSAATNVSNLVWSLSPTDLAIQNEETLKKLGYKNKQVKTFFSNKVFTPTQQTALVAALRSLNKVEGREFLLAMASSAETVTEGEFVVQTALFYQLYHDKFQALSRLAHTPNGTLPMAITMNEALFFAPLDYLMWTDDVAAGTARADELAKEIGITGVRRLWVEGRMSPTAKTRLNADGWAESTNGFKKLQAMIDNR